MKKNRKPIEFARSVSYERINFEDLTEEDICEFDDTGYTLLHYIAKDGMWDHLPKKLQDKRYWQESPHGDTIYMAAYSGGRDEWIDKRELSESDILKRNSRGDFIAWIATKNKTLYMLPKKIITERVLRAPIKTPPPKEYKALLIHQIATHQMITAVSKGLLTQELLSRRDSSGKSTYHILASTQQSGSLPPHLWTRSALTLKSKDGETPLHDIAFNAPSLIPKTISLEEIIVKNDKGNTPLHSWCQGFGWVNIPNKFLTNETLNIVGEYESPLDILLFQYVNGMTAKNKQLEDLMRPKIVHVLKQLHTKKLLELVKDEKPAVSKLAIKEKARRKVIQLLASNPLKNIEI
jgi:hypothetical protein